MKKVAIIDDDENIRSTIKEYLKKYEQASKEQFIVSDFAFPELFLTNYKPEYDIVMMDIDMPGMNGLTAARKLRNLDERVVLLFVTNLAQYALKGYEVAATDFIVKPLKYERFSQKLERALRFVPESTRPMLMIRTESATITVELDDIIYVEVNKHDVYYHTVKDVYRVRGSLKQAEEDLGDPKFFACDKSCLVNLAYVEGVSAGTVTVAGNELCVSRSKKKPLIDALAAFHNRK